MGKLINDTSLKSVVMTVTYKELPKGYVTARVGKQNGR